MKFALLSAGLRMIAGAPLHCYCIDINNGGAGSDRRM